MFKKNCCDGIYNSLDVHFTSACDNKCAHCIDSKYQGLGINKPKTHLIFNTIWENRDKYDDVLFLGGEPCLYLDELMEVIPLIKAHTNLKVFVTTSVPKICYDKFDLFKTLLETVDGINLSVQHYKEDVADEIRQTKSQFDRQAFYESLPYKEKIRINLNICKPYLYKADDLINCLRYYDRMGFASIKLSEIQHGKEFFVRFEDIFNIKLPSPFYGGCQTYLKLDELLPDWFSGFKTPFLLKRSCFACEETLKASFMDGVKTVYKLFIKPNNNYGVVYGDGTLTKGWV